MKKILLTLLVGMFLISLINLASAQFYYKQSTELDLNVPCFNNNTICSDSTICNISILYPNGTFLIDDQTMTNLQNGYHNYTLNESQTSILGEYSVSIYCDDVGEKGYSTFTFEITANGNERPEGFVIVLFVVLFLIILAALITLFLYTIGHFVEKDFDLKDLTYNISAYFVLWGIYILGKEYLGNLFVNSFLEWVIDIGAFTNVLWPLIVFIISITIWRWEELAP